MNLVDFSCLKKKKAYFQKQMGNVFESVFN